MYNASDFVYVHRGGIKKPTQDRREHVYWEQQMRTQAFEPRKE